MCKELRVAFVFNILPPFFHICVHFGRLECRMIGLGGDISDKEVGTRDHVANWHSKTADSEAYRSSSSRI